MDISTLTNSVLKALTIAKNDKGELGKFYEDFKNATVKWLRPLFLIDDGKNNLDEYINGEDDDLEAIVKAKIEYFFKKNPDKKAIFEDHIENLKPKSDEISKIIIDGEKNVVLSKSNKNKIDIK